MQTDVMRTCIVMPVDLCPSSCGKTQWAREELIGGKRALSLRAILPDGSVPPCCTRPRGAPQIELAAEVFLISTPPERIPVPVLGNEIHDRAGEYFCETIEPQLKKVHRPTAINQSVGKDSEELQRIPIFRAQNGDDVITCLVAGRYPVN